MLMTIHGVKVVNKKKKRRRRRRICVFVVAYRVLSKRNYFKCLTKVEIVKYMKTILKDI